MSLKSRVSHNWHITNHTNNLDYKSKHILRVRALIAGLIFIIKYKIEQAKTIFLSENTWKFIQKTLTIQNKLEIESTMAKIKFE